MELLEKDIYYENHNAWFYRNNKKLYKVYKSYVPETLEVQLMYNQTIQPELDRHIILPTKLLYDEKYWLVGYTMRFVNGNTLEKELEDNKLPFEDKILLINDYFRLLKSIHNYLIVGDIRNNNLMIGKNKEAYMIDFDYAKKIDSSIIPFCRYHIKYNDETLNDKNEDLLKLFISALSLLYGYDIESIIALYEDINYIDSFVPLSGCLKDYYFYLKDNVLKHKQADYYLQLPFEKEIEKEINTAKSRILIK